MKKVITILLMAFAPLTFADTNQEVELNNKKMDETNFCYYADLEYSIGAKMLQEGKSMRCAHISETDLKYTNEQKDILVWVSNKY